MRNVRAFNILLLLFSISLHFFLFIIWWKMFRKIEKAKQITSAWYSYTRCNVHLMPMFWPSRYAKQILNQHDSARAFLDSDFKIEPKIEREREREHERMFMGEIEKERQIVKNVNPATAKKMR